jgi:formamidopyrimidine-DNA glycosylase
MPELPEVEIVKQGLLKSLPKDEIQEVQTFRKDLRFPLPLKELAQLKNHSIKTISRRGKFLILETTSRHFISHLGMTGHWRFESTYSPLKHDHIRIQWNSQNLIYNDPRRFGYILNYEIDLFKNFGPDPILDILEAKNFYPRYKKSETNIKTFLLNQKNILGIGNIYASEILFKAKIKPLKKVRQLKLQDWESILVETKLVLNKAITLGGSSMRDYKNVEGDKGDMQNHWLVYGKQSIPCSVCKTAIKNITISNRSSYFCSQCQK